MLNTCFGWDVIDAKNEEICNFHVIDDYDKAQNIKPKHIEWYYSNS